MISRYFASMTEAQEAIKKGLLVPMSTVAIKGDLAQVIDKGEGETTLVLTGHKAPAVTWVSEPE
jgi:hypothetical protein